MRRRLRTDGVAWQAVDDQIVCLDLESSRYLAVNGTGTVLWPLLVEGTDDDALSDRLVDTFQIDHDTAARDVDAFVRELEHRSLLEDV